MQFFANKKVWQISGSLLAAVILFWAIFSGINSGKALAQAHLVAQNAESLKAGLDFFYQDQNRFPAASEFQNSNIMGAYLVNFPPLSFVSALCPDSFIYKRPSLKSFELNFCLPAGFGGNNTGWNKIIGQK